VQSASVRHKGKSRNAIDERATKFVEFTYSNQSLTEYHYGLRSTYRAVTLCKSNPSLQTNADNHKLLTNLVVPRPIAWVTSLSSTGLVNRAPFSFFNAVGSDPLYVVISIGRRDDGSLKDTAENIQTSSEFVVNLVTEELLAA
jgi:hypothetical protein